MTAVTPIPARRGIWNSKESPMAPPRNSARSVAIAATSLITHIAQTIGWGNCSRHISARFRPVTIPSLAERAENLGQIGRHCGNLADYPHRPDNRLGKLLAAHLSEVPSGDNTKFGGEGLEPRPDRSPLRQPR